MLENPILVIRVLLIEELANPLFEKFLQKPELLLTLEQQVTDNAIDGPSFTQALEGLSEEQKVFVKSFLAQKPRFRDETGVRVKSVQPYIYLSSDSSFGDIRGLSPQEFTKYLSQDDIAQLTTILSTSGEQKIQEAISAFSSEFSSLANGPSKHKLFSNLIQIVLQTDPKLPVKNILTNFVLNCDLSFIDQLEPAAKMQTIEELGKLDLSEAEFNELLSKVPNYSATEWANIASLETGEFVTRLTQHKFLRYFKEYFLSNPGDALSQIGPRVSAFDARAVNAELTTHIEKLINYFITDNNDTRRYYGVALLRKTDTGFAALKDRLSNELSAKNSPIFNWLAGPAKLSSEPIFTMQTMVDSVINGPMPISSIADLNDRLTLFQSLPEAKDMLWDALLKLDRNLLIDALYESIVIDNYISLAPTNDAANQLIDTILHRFVNKEAATSQNTLNWLTRIAPNYWLFRNLKLSKANIAFINARLDSQYLNDEQKQQLERIKTDFSEV